MNLLLIILGVLAILIALKFIKTIGKVFFTVILLLALLVISYGVFEFNVIIFILNLL